MAGYGYRKKRHLRHLRHFGCFFLVEREGVWTSRASMTRRTSSSRGTRRTRGARGL